MIHIFCDVIDSRPCKNLQQNPPENVFFFSIRLSDRLRRSFEGCDPGWKSNIGSNVLRINKNHVFFDEGFFGSRIFSLFLLAQKEFLGQNLQRFNAFGDAIFFGFACFYSEMERERGAV